ncbi:hypothetical protein CCZ01_01410 [Helicobacter monodelphidis]|uniref:glycosyltransferase n=1 Tax=Helicobacter sp. 15-1451 TaxID=2004995 RepID=UPI000DCBB8F1|nr:glycosyltransferase [Helicobacter sp. 15-1451]RAX58881.1 hypothetical protein CCZ01_01410 [Helicobacter sp. 15-1451]
MKVLHFGKFYPPHYGGIEQVIKNYVEGLNAIGVQADVLCVNDFSYSSVESFSYAGVKVDSRPLYTVYRMANLGLLASAPIAPMLIWKLKQIAHRYDIIHIHHPDPFAALALFLVQPKCKVVLHWHSDIVRQKYLLKLYHPLLLWLIRRANLILGATKNHIQKSDYTAFFGDKAVILPFIIPPLKVPLNPVSTKMNPHQFNIFALGRLVHYKGFKYLIESALHLGVDYAIYIGGQGKLEFELSKQIQDLNLQKRVFLLGGLSEEEVFSYYQECDVFALPSILRTEMFGVVQVEAMSFKKPIVSTQILHSGVSEVNVHGQSGLIVPVCDSLALAKAFTQLKEDTKLYHRLSMGAYARSQNFNQQEIIQNLLNLYKSL